MSPYSQPMNLRLHSHESLFPANGMNLRLHSHESLFPAKFLESFGWYHPCPAHPTSGVPIESTQLRPERDFGGTPYQYTWVPPKSIVERFRALLRDLRF